MIDNYYTIKEKRVFEFKEQRSLFLSEAFPVNSADEIKEILLSQRKKYFDANHVCYAWRLGINNAEFHYSDDGEPAGTAGVRILNEIKTSELTNVLVTVTRFFGGIKLGVGSLGKAYDYSAKKVLEQCDKIKIWITQKLRLNLSYEEYNKIQKPIERFVHSVDNITFLDKVEIIINVRLSALIETEKFLDEFFNGKKVFVRID